MVCKIKLEDTGYALRSLAEKIIKLTQSRETSRGCLFDRKEGPTIEIKSDKKLVNSNNISKAGNLGSLFNRDHNNHIKLLILKKELRADKLIIDAGEERQ